MLSHIQQLYPSEVVHSQNLACIAHDRDDLFKNIFLLIAFYTIISFENLPISHWGTQQYINDCQGQIYQKCVIFNTFPEVCHFLTPFSQCSILVLCMYSNCNQLSICFNWPYSRSIIIRFSVTLSKYTLNNIYMLKCRALSRQTVRFIIH